MNTIKTKVMIIGAGPYGIAIANSLFAKKIPFQISGDIFSLWYEHTLETMSLRSDWHTSEIFSPGNEYSIKEFLKKNYPETWREILKDRMPVTVFREYLKDVQKRLPYPVISSPVRTLEKQNGLYLITLEDGSTIISESAVVATGIGIHLNLPESLRHLHQVKVLHTWDQDRYAHWSGKELLVIGAGQSAAETIIQTKTKNTVTWLLRKDPVYYSEPLNLPTFIFKIVLHLSPYFYFLPKSLRKKFGEKFVKTTITPDLKEGVTSPEVKTIKSSIEDMQLMPQGEQIWSEKLQKSFDAIIAATGFKYHLNHCTFLSQEIQEQVHTDEGIPQLSYEFETSEPNLFMVGGIAEPVYGPAQRFMMGARHAAQKITSVAAQR